MPTDAHITYRQQHSRCNKPGCLTCAPGARGHGPYWYAYWQEDGKLRSRYLGKERPTIASTDSSIQDRPLDAEPVAATSARRHARGSRAIPSSLAVPPLRVRTLGSFVVWRGGRRIPAAAWRRRNAALLFKALVSAPAHRLHREQAAELIWPDADPGRVGNNLRFTLHQLRAILDSPGAPASYLQSRDGELALVAAPGLDDAIGDRAYPPGWLDAAAFNALATRAMAGKDSAACEAALALYAGDYLPEERYQDWAVQRREELAGQRLALLLHRARLCTGLRGHEEVVAAWRAVLAVDPCQEEAAYALMRRLAGGGRAGEALRVYNALATALREELGLTPAAAIQQLRARLTAQEASAPQPPDAQIAPDANPAGLPVEHPAARPTNLPVSLTSFIERPREQAEVRDLLRTTRLLTVVGMGGAGKTRLALHVARDVVEDFADGVWLVELAALADPDLVLEAVATLVGLGEMGPNRPLLASLIEHLRPKHMLLVLDNCEHLLGTCAELVDALLTACPRLCVLATSRESLDVPGETLYRVPSLSLPNLDDLPPPEQLLRNEAVQLFVERARAQRPTFALTRRNAQAVCTICLRLDGIPLAIELAAARVGALQVEGIAARLDDRFRLLTGGPRTAQPRQRTLRAALDWSHDLLSEPERILLRRLAVFAGGWTLEAAETVCVGDEVGNWEVLDLLMALVNKSLVNMDEREDVARYWLHETMRDYAHEKLAASGEAIAMHERHIAWCLALAEEGAAGLVGPNQHEWLNRLALEHDNLRAALTWSAMVDVQHAEGPATRLRLAGALWRFWWMHGHLHEGRRWLEDALAGDGPFADAFRARALDGAGVLAADQGDYLRARARHEESLAIWRALGDRRGIAGALNNLGSAAQQQGDYVVAEPAHEESLALWSSLGDAQGVANALNQLGCIARDQQGDYARAGALLEEALTVRQRLGDRRGIAIALNNLGLVAFYQGDYARAGALLEEALTVRQRLGDRRGIAISLGNLARVASHQGDHARGRTLYGQSLALRLDLGDKRGITECLEGLAMVARAEQQPDQAARLLGAAYTRRAEIGLPLQVPYPTTDDDDLAAIRQ